MNKEKRGNIIKTLEGLEALPAELLNFDIDEIANSKNIQTSIDLLNLLYSADSRILHARFFYFLDECVSNEVAYGRFLADLAGQDLQVAPALFRYLRRTGSVPEGANLQILLLGIGGDHVEVRADAIMLLAKQTQSFLERLDTFDEDVDFRSIESTQRFNQARAISIAKDMSKGASFEKLVTRFPHENRSVLQLLLLRYAVK